MSGEIVIGGGLRDMDADYTFRVEDIIGGGGGGAGALAHVGGARYIPPPDEGMGGGGGGGFGSAAPRRNPRRHHRDAMSFDEIMAAGEDADEPASKKKRKSYMNTGVPWRMEFIDRYGHPKDPSECFACMFRLQGNKMTVRKRDMQVLIKILRTCPAHMSPEAMAVQLSEKQTEMAHRVNRNKAIDDPTRIPIWDPATVLDHLETHLMAPALYTRLMFGKCMRHIKHLEEKCLMRVDKNDGDECYDPVQVRCFKDFAQMAQSFAKNQLNRMTFHNPGAVIDEAQVSHPVAMDAFRLFESHKKRKRGYE